jgi:hypothetical protein
MSWNTIGWCVALGLGALGSAISYIAPAAALFGYFLLAVAALSFFAALWGACRSGLPYIKDFNDRLGAKKMMLLVGIAGTWLFLTFTLGVIAWRIALPNAKQIEQTDDSQEGPISWIRNFTMEGGLRGANIFSLRFHGANISKDQTIELKTANITSLIDGSRIQLEVTASDGNSGTKIVTLDKIQLIPPGAPIELVAKFGPPDPSNPGKILGLEPRTFLEKWRQFAFEAVDDKRAYKFDFNENAFVAFFQGQVGPRVALKPDAQ